MTQEDFIDVGLAALLGNDDASAQAVKRLAKSTPELLEARIDYHGIGHLLASRLDAASAISTRLRAYLRESAMAREFWEESHMRMLRPALAALVDRGVVPVVMKGTALAYSLYPAPAARTRGDTDLLVHPEQLPQARTVLRELGFTLGREVHGKLFQENWYVMTSGGLLHEIDLHWQVNDSPVLQQALPLDAVLADTVPLDALQAGARALAGRDALIQLAFNARWHADFGYMLGAQRLAGARRLVWAYDAHLLLQALDEGEWQLLVARAIASGAAPAVVETIEHAQAALGTQASEDYLAALRAAPGDTPIVRYLHTAERKARLKADFLASRGLRAKAGLAATMLRPGRSHLRSKFPQARGWPLPALYLRYLVEGAARLMRS